MPQDSGEVHVAARDVQIGRANAGQVDAHEHLALRCYRIFVMADESDEYPMTEDELNFQLEFFTDLTSKGTG